MIKIRGLIIPDEDKINVSELIKVNLFTYRNIDFRDRIPLNLCKDIDSDITSFISLKSYLIWPQEPSILEL